MLGSEAQLWNSFLSLKICSMPALPWASVEIQPLGCFEWFDRPVKMRVLAAEHRGGAHIVAVGFTS